MILGAEPGRAAEVKVYDALKSLPDDYIVFYSVNWLWRKRDMASHKKELHKEYPPELGGLPKGTPYPIGETDFILIAPDFGLIVIEVKGGSINIVNGTWYSIDRKGHPSFNPTPT